MNSAYNCNVYIKGNCSYRPHFQVPLSGLFYTGLSVFKLGHIDHVEIIMKLLVCGKHLYDHILSLRGVVTVHKIRFFEVPVPRQESGGYEY